MNNKREYLLLFVYNLRKNLPNSQFFYTSYAFAKFIGLILISHNVGNMEDNVHCLPLFILNFTVFGRGYKQYISSYLSVLIIFFFCIVGFSLLTFITIIILHKKHGRSLYDKLSKWEDTLVRTLAFVFTVIAFFSQHLIEYFTLGILDVSFPNENFLGNNSSSVDFIFLTFCVTNVILSEAISIAFFYISKSFSCVSPIGDPNIFTFSSADLLMIVMTSLQGIFALHNLKESAESFHYYLNMSIAIILFLHFIFQFKIYNYYETNFSLFFEKFLFYFCFISSLDEIAICHLCTNPFKQSYSFCKLGLEVINAVLFAKLNIMYINSIYMKNFSQKVFSDKLKLTPFDLLAYVKEIFKFKNKEIAFSSIFQIFSLHKEHCSVAKCPCHNLSVVKWINQVKAAHKEVDETEVINRSYEDFVVIGEHEISKMIYYYLKSKGSRRVLDRLIVLHIEYILNVKKQLSNALYLTSQYLIVNSEKMSFMTVLTLYEFKLIIFDRLTKEKRNAAKTELGNALSKEKDEAFHNYEKITTFYNHTLSLEKIRLLLITCCELLSKILDFCKTIEVKTTRLEKKCEYFFKICKTYQKSHKELCDLLLKEKRKIKHYEISFMLSAYFNCSLAEIPENIKDTFKIISSYSYFSSKKQFNSYKDFKKVNPIMVFINPNDEFIIKYISISLCSQLNYKRQELLNGEFNQLLPKELVSMHNAVLKRFVLSSNRSFRKNSFIFDKEKNMIPIGISCNTILTLESSFGIIISVDFTSPCSPFEKEYYLLLNKDMMIMSMNKAFPEDFFFTLQIFQILKMNFCTFFGINQERICLKAKTLFNPTDPLISSLEEENKTLTIFSKRNAETMFNEGKEGHGCMHASRKVVIHDKILKKNIIKNLDNINKMIEELGLDIEWFTRVNCLRERLELVKCIDLETDYTVVSIEDLIYIIVNLKEKINYHQRDSLEVIKEISKNNITLMSNSRRSVVESNRNGQKYSNSKLRSNRSITDAQEINSAAKLRVGNSAHQQPLSGHPGQSIRKDGTISGSSVNSMLTLNKTSIALLNLPDIAQKKSSNNKEFALSVIAFETRELFACKVVQKYLHWSYKIVGLCVLILSLMPFIFNSSFMNKSKSLYDITLYSLMLKSNIYFSSLEILKCCDIAESNALPGLKEQRIKLASLADEMINHFSIFSQTLNKLAKEAQMKPIFNLVNSNNDYKKMMKNFETATKSEELYDELFFFHFYLIQLSEETSFQSCRLRTVFTNKAYENLIGTLPGPNYEEMVVYEIINNVLFSLRAKMEELTQVTLELLQSHFQSSKVSLLLYNCILMVLVLLLGGSFIAIIQYNKNNMQILLNMIYTKYLSEDKFEKEIKAFRVILDDYSHDNCLKFEEAKKIQPKRQSIELIADKKADKRKRTINSSGKSVINLDGRIKKFSRELTTPKQVKFSVSVTICFMVSFGVIIAINIFFSQQLYDNLMFAIVISINYINLVPKICELFMYSKVSMILNDVYFIKTPLTEYNNASYSNYYNITLDTEANTMFATLKDSEFAFLYYQLLQIEGNLVEFSSRDKSPGILSQLTQWEHSFNSKEGLCLFGALGYYSFSSNTSDSVAAMNYISSEVAICRSSGNGMTMNSLNDYIDLSSQELKNIYIDFASLDAQVRDPMAFLANNIFSTIGSITTGALKNIHDTVMYYISSDLNQICKQNNLVSLIFSLVLIGLCLGVFLYVHFFLIQEIEKNIDTLSFIQGIKLKTK